MSSTGREATTSDKSSETGAEVRAEDRAAEPALADRAVADEVAAPGPGVPRPEPRQILSLQRLAGNRAVAASMERKAPIPVQRHSSWEHAMLGDVQPTQLASAVNQGRIPSQNRQHVLQDELNRVSYFQHDPGRPNPHQAFPDIRWIQLRGSQLWVSYGEMNALADYLPDATTVDTLPRERLIPVLQRMREGIADQCREVLQRADPAWVRAARAVDRATGGPMAEAEEEAATRFSGAARSAVSAVSSAGGEVRALNSATSQLGQNRYQGLLARNACHFAPMSWQRWSEYHAQARQGAIAHHASSQASSGNGVGVNAEENERQAWLQNGYGDHFLEDSFAAGHLVNKTLVMQWFAQYLVETFPWIIRPTVGVPGRDVLEAMEDPTYPSRGQAGIAGRQLYHSGPNFQTTDANDRATSTSPTDIQSAQERDTRAGRVGGSGVVAEGGATQEARYANYDEFLNSSYMQGAGKAAHDWFNARGLSIRNGRNEWMRVGGDDTLLTQSDARGAEMAGTAAHLSQRAITELLATGTTAITPEQIFAYVPVVVIPVGSPNRHEYPLEQWNDDVLRDLCWSTIFPSVVNDPTNDLLRGVSSTLVPGGVTH